MFFLLSLHLQLLCPQGMSCPRKLSKLLRSHSLSAPLLVLCKIRVKFLLLEAVSCMVIVCSPDYSIQHSYGCWQQDLRLDNFNSGRSISTVEMHQKKICSFEGLEFLAVPWTEMPQRRNKGEGITLGSKISTGIRKLC